VSSSPTRIIALARHEYRAAVRSKILAALIGILVVVTVASVYIAATKYRSQVADFRAARAAAPTGNPGQLPPTPFALLALLRGAMEYLEIIGAVIAITLGYLSVSRERVNRTLPLIRSRPVTSRQLAAGNILGALAIIATLVLVTAIAAVLCLGFVGHDWPNGEQMLKLLLAYFAAVLYLGVFYCLGAVCTIRSRVAVNGLMAALGIWLLVVLVIPQIGDTLDADNQLPGGLFSALALDKPQEIKVVSHFDTYEKIRNGIEETSFAKHFERFTFAMTDVKASDRGLNIWELIQAKQHDIYWTIFWMLLLGTAFTRAFRRQPIVPEGGT